MYTAAAGVRAHQTRPSLVSSFFFRLGAGLKAAVPVMSRPDTSTLTSYVPSYLSTGTLVQSSFATIPAIARNPITLVLGDVTEGSLRSLPT